MQPCKVAFVGQPSWEDDTNIKIAIDSFINIEKTKHGDIEVNIFWQEPFSTWVKEKCEQYNVPYNVFLGQNRESYWVTNSLGKFTNVVSGAVPWVSDELIENSSIGAIFHEYLVEDDALSVINYMKQAHMYIVEPLHKFFGDKYLTYEDAKNNQVGIG